MGDEIFLITYYNDISVLNDGFARAESEKILREIFDSMMKLCHHPQERG